MINKLLKNKYLLFAIFVYDLWQIFITLKEKLSMDWNYFVVNIIVKLILVIIIIAILSYIQKLIRVINRQDLKLRLLAEINSFLLIENALSNIEIYQDKEIIVEGLKKDLIRDIEKYLQRRHPELSPLELRKLLAELGMG